MAIISNFPAGGGGSKSLNNAVITLATSSFVYDGTEKNQQIQSVVLNGTTLHEGVDYLVTGNLATEAGTHTIIILGVGNYNGFTTTTWNIAKAQGSITVNPSTIKIKGAGNVETATINFTGNGAISVNTNNENIVTASISGNVLSVVCVGEGNAVVTVSLGEGDNYLGASCNVNVISNLAYIYGVSWDGTSTTKWTRTDRAADFVDPVPYIAGATNYGSPFDELMPWSGMKTIESDTAGTLVSIPKFWYKLEQNGAGMKIQIADMPQDGFHVSPAHMERGDGKGEKEVIYIGRYHCADTTYKSTSGSTPKTWTTRSDVRSAVHAFGSDIWQVDWPIYFTIWLLYLVEYADWNSQEKIGYGGTITTTGYTDSMPYHTGTTLSNRTSYGSGIQYRYIEGLWGGVSSLLDGCYFDSSYGFRIILNPNEFSGVESRNSGISIGMLWGGGWSSTFNVKNVDGLFQLFFPSGSNGSSSTYSCDYCSYTSGYYYPVIGGGGQSLNNGLFCINFSDTGRGGGTSCRLMKL